MARLKWWVIRITFWNGHCVFENFDRHPHVEQNIHQRFDWCEYQCEYGNETPFTQRVEEDYSSNSLQAHDRPPPGGRIIHQCYNCCDYCNLDLQQNRSLPHGWNLWVWRDQYRFCRQFLVCLLHTPWPAPGRSWVWVGLMNNPWNVVGLKVIFCWMWLLWIWMKCLAGEAVYLRRREVRGEVGECEMRAKYEHDGE